MLPDWFWSILGASPAGEGAAISLGDARYVVRGGIPRHVSVLSDTQSQTSRAFGFKWGKRDTFESDSSRARMRQWLVERYGPVERFGWNAAAAVPPTILDAGCGAAMSALEYFSPCLKSIRYFGVDVSGAVDVARDRFAERGIEAGFLQADLAQIPRPAAGFDAVFSEGVLHHTDSTRASVLALARLLKPGGLFLFYVYRKKGPLREFADDHIRARLREMPPERAWEAMKPLTALGVELGRLGARIRVEQPIELLEIPAGEYDLQRFFYWHVAKAFFRPEMTFDEMNHINFDWYAPANAHRHTPEEVREWCAAAGLEIEREVVEEAGITIVARRGSHAGAAR